MFAHLHHLSHHAAWRHQLEMLLESAGEGIYGVDQNGRCIFINRAGAELIGVNNRNLKTLDVDTDTFARLAPLIPPSCVRIAESGVTGPQEAELFARAGADAILVGEALVVGGDPAHGVRSMIAAGQQ